MFLKNRICLSGCNITLPATRRPVNSELGEKQHHVGWLTLDSTGLFFPCSERSHPTSVSVVSVRVLSCLVMCVKCVCVKCGEKHAPTDYNRGSSPCQQLDSLVARGSFTNTVLIGCPWVHIPPPACLMWRLIYWCTGLTPPSTTSQHYRMLSLQRQTNAWKDLSTSYIK